MKTRPTVRYVIRTTCFALISRAEPCSCPARLSEAFLLETESDLSFKERVNMGTRGAFFGPPSSQSAFGIEPAFPLKLRSFCVQNRLLALNYIHPGDDDSLFVAHR
jgi:hypothetical protein